MIVYGKWDDMNQEDGITFAQNWMSEDKSFRAVWIGLVVFSIVLWTGTIIAIVRVL